MNSRRFRIAFRPSLAALRSPRLYLRLFRYISVQKLLILAALAIVLLFDVFHVYVDPTSVAPVGSLGFEIARAITALFLFILLVTEPPRAVAFRLLLGAGAIIIMAATSYGLLNYQLGFIDTVLYLEVAIILGLEALEPKTEPRALNRLITKGRPLV